MKSLQVVVFGSGLNAYVVADLRHLGPEVIIEKLHGIRDLAMTFEHCDPLGTTGTYSSNMSLPTMGGIDVVDYKTCACEVPGFVLLRRNFLYLHPRC